MAKYVPWINPLRANRHRAGTGIGAPVRKIAAPVSRQQPDSPAPVRRRTAKAIPQDDFDILASRPEPRTRFCERFPP